MVSENKQNRSYKQINCNGPQLPDQESTVDLFLFLRLKSIMKGAGFTDVAAIQERVTAVLQSIRKVAFADSFQKLYERCPTVCFEGYLLF
jgi:hypothetical protein